MVEQNVEYQKCNSRMHPPRKPGPVNLLRLFNCSLAVAFVDLEKMPWPQVNDCVQSGGKRIGAACFFSSDEERKRYILTNYIRGNHNGDWAIQPSKNEKRPLGRLQKQRNNAGILRLHSCALSC